MEVTSSSKCRQCGKTCEHQPISGFCSHGCYGRYIKSHKEPNCVCPVCGASFYIKPSKIASTKHLICCSKECSRIYRSKWFSGTGNHQYGLKGSKNPTFSGKEIIRKNHRNKDVRVYVPYRPDADNIGRVIKHKLIVEENYSKFGEKYFDLIDGVMVLKKGFVVHHKDGNHDNNDISNLEILTRGEHTSLHNGWRKINNKNKKK